jgi:NADH:ubiquinone oxidoreductase subunit E
MLEMNVCVGSSCHLKGSYNIIHEFQHLLEEENLHDRVEMKAQFCMKQCQQGVSVSVGEEFFSVSPEMVRDFFKNTVLPQAAKEAVEKTENGS